MLCDHVYPGQMCNETYIAYRGISALSIALLLLAIRSRDSQLAVALEIL